MLTCLIYVYISDKYVKEPAYCNVREFIMATCECVANMCCADTEVQAWIKENLHSKHEQKGGVGRRHILSKRKYSRNLSNCRCTAHMKIIVNEMGPWIIL